ncbi:flagellar assembly protein FliW [Cohnella lubricantis]|uniref:Flagellar assembly factor FliW n=1 Tax=Cohnella lubricantis TaxID=2163172 RepID=A0A841TDU7_9BACL|nr:flagellar assembly protein FliW [Cohnella lubricantis]MBB6677410.1 flagellar assembly protein FliW [Cohnella lubricantis]MBP2118699.1 flagellar assembly factor FliW [Cohnella lubricantis]
MFEKLHNRVFGFKGSLLGFDAYDEFRFTVAEENPSFGYLESVEDPNTGFIVTSPFRFFPAYEFAIDEKDKAELEIKEPEEVLVLSIINVKNPFLESTVNLMAPLIINVTNHQGRQIILTSPYAYGTKERLFKPAPKESGEDAC